MKSNELEHKSSWEDLIQLGYPQDVQPPAHLYHRIVKQMFPGWLTLWTQLVSALLLLASPPLFGYLSIGNSSPDSPVPGIVYTLYGVLAVLLLLPFTLRLFGRFESNWILLSRQIDERFLTRVRH
ncbi:MAG: hypothetical protein K8S54_05220 [Spirochaetia bacterium]|nr:hypothetical protein [Spirochaetia bacterium]